MLKTYTVHETSHHGGMTINLLLELLSDNSHGYTVQLLNSVDDILIECIDKESAWKLYETLSNSDDYHFIV